MSSLEDSKQVTFSRHKYSAISREQTCYVQHNKAYKNHVTFGVSIQQKCG